ncbi:hypothetical protein [Mesorhizobium sp. ANAO-SY3R2]|uniref:hypothetical protein n=1 Tax=Mesorhizobium sp. ANAO-SY3R2 TaxID=3166644 RepID=UPI00366E317F
MARTPVNQTSGHHADQAPSRGGGATGLPIVIATTGSARIYAEKQGFDLTSYTERLSPDCQTGDIVSVFSGGVRHDFAVLRRRWVIGEPNSSLEITLDYPVRGR